MDEIEYKQYVIVPKRPHMSPGKIASQVAHATYMAIKKQRDKVTDLLGLPLIVEQSDARKIREWETSGMCVIVLECEHPNQLAHIAKYLDQWKIVNHLYIDEGLTEVLMGTPTALATGVLKKEDHWIFSTLELYTEKKPWWKK